MDRHHDDDDDEKGKGGDEEEDDSEEEGFRLLMGGRLRWEDLASAPLEAWDDHDQDQHNASSDSGARDVDANSNSNDTSNHEDAADSRDLSLDPTIATAREAEGLRDVALSGHLLPFATGRPGEQVDGRAEKDAILQEIHDDKAEDDRDSFVYSLAHGFELSGSVVQDRGSRTVRMADIPGKGRGLVATRQLPRRAVVYTERAAVACQVAAAEPFRASVVSKNGGGDYDDGGETDRASNGGEVGRRDDGLYDVRACQQCFRSLEPCLDGLPHPELWPAVGPGSVGVGVGMKRTSRPWPSRCQGCGSWFCSTGCHQQHSKQYGSCCDLRKATRLLLAPFNHSNVDWSAEPAIALAIRMLRHCLQRHRHTHSLEMSDGRSNDLSDSALEGTLLWGLCGDAADVTPLELGIPDAVTPDLPNNTSSVPLREPTQDKSSRTGPGLNEEAHSCAAETQQSPSSSLATMTLEPLYKQLVELWCVSPHEASILSLNLFHKLAAMAARNGIGMSPVSPFTTYYQALVRHAGGRGTAAHSHVVEQVAGAISDGATTCLVRGMDRQIQEKVSPKLVAIFPLTSRINHDCAPNAELVTSFVDCHVDVQLVRDVRAGEEITINYVGRFGGRNKSLECRQTELRRKYLFFCRCRLCLVNSAVEATR